MERAVRSASPEFRCGAQVSLCVKTNEFAHAPTTPCIPPIELQFQRRRAVLSADAEQVFSDGGVVLLRNLDDRLGLTARLRGIEPLTSRVRLLIDAKDPHT
jgi:hypothetical protein